MQETLNIRSPIESIINYYIWIISIVIIIIIIIILLLLLLLLDSHFTTILFRTQEECT